MEYRSLELLAQRIWSDEAKTIVVLIQLSNQCLRFRVPRALIPIWYRMDPMNLNEAYRGRCVADIIASRADVIRRAFSGQRVSVAPCAWYLGQQKRKVHHGFNWQEQTACASMLLITGHLPPYFTSLPCLPNFPVRLMI